MTVCRWRCHTGPSGRRAPPPNPTARRCPPRSSLSPPTSPGAFTPRCPLHPQRPPAAPCSHCPTARGCCTSPAPHLQRPHRHSPPHRTASRRPPSRPTTVHQTGVAAARPSTQPTWGGRSPPPSPAAGATHSPPCTTPTITGLHTTAPHHTSNPYPPTPGRNSGAPSPTSRWTCRWGRSSRCPPAARWWSWMVMWTPRGGTASAWGSSPTYTAPTPARGPGCTSGRACSWSAGGRAMCGCGV